MLQTGLGSGGGGGCRGSPGCPPCSLSGFSRRTLGPLKLATSICQCQGHWLAWGRQRNSLTLAFILGLFPASSVVCFVI